MPTRFPTTESIRLARYVSATGNSREALELRASRAKHANRCTAVGRRRAQQGRAVAARQLRGGIDRVFQKTRFSSSRRVAERASLRVSSRPRRGSAAQPVRDVAQCSPSRVFSPRWGFPMQDNDAARGALASAPRLDSAPRGSAASRRGLRFAFRSRISCTFQARFGLRGQFSTASAFQQTLDRPRLDARLDQSQTPTDSTSRPVGWRWP